MPEEQRQILVIDLLRFLCALLVVAHHYLAGLPLTPPDFARYADVPAQVAPFAWAGWVGVELFFVVSGYVIATSVGTGGPRGFMRRRVLRLAPAAWIAATLTTLFALAAAIEPVDKLLLRWSASIAFWPFEEQADPAYWTLGIETAFYLLIAGLLAAFRRPRMVEALGLALGLASLTYWAQQGGWAATAVHDRWRDASLLPHGGFFAIGIGLHASARRGIGPAQAATLLAGLVAGVCEIGAQARFMATALDLDVTPLLPLALFAAGFTAIACAGPLQPILARTLGGARLRRMGALTYPLYLVHMRLGFVVIAGLTALGLSGGVAVALTAAFVLAVAMAIAERLEPALRRWLTARFDAFSPFRAPAPDIPPNASPRAG